MRLRPWSLSIKAIWFYTERHCVIVDIREEWRWMRTGQCKEHNIKIAPRVGKEFKGHCQWIKIRGLMASEADSGQRVQPSSSSQRKSRNIVRWPKALNQEKECPCPPSVLNCCGKSRVAGPPPFEVRTSPAILGSCFANTHQEAELPRAEAGSALFRAGSCVRDQVLWRTRSFVDTAESNATLGEKPP